jgi:hypothetical protein
VTARATIIMIMLAVAACGPPAPPPGLPATMQEPSAQALREAATAFHTVRDGFLEWYYEAYPVRASELGINLHDAQLTAMDRVAVQRRIGALLDWQADLRRIPVQLMRDEDRSEYAVLDFALRGELLNLEEVRRHAVDPREYTSLLTRGLVTVAEGRHAPVAERAEALRARMEAAPALLAAARTNLRAPARIWTELAVEETRGLMAYLEEELPGRLGAPDEAAALAALEPARGELVAALRDHAEWLETTLLPTSTGEFRLGRYLFGRVLLYDGHVDLSIQELERQNDDRMAEYRTRFEAVAAEIDASRTPRAILDSIGQLTPDVDAVVPTARDMVAEARAWTQAAGVVTIPREGVPDVRASPAYLVHGLTDLRAPGPFGDPSVDAVYHVAVPQPEWPEARQRRQLSRLSQPALRAATLRETFPGDYVRRLHGPGVAGQVSRVFTPRTFADGWADYAEQMALDEGFRDGDLAIRLVQLRRALHGHGLWDAAIQLHAQGQPLDRVVERFARTAHVDPAIARQEVLRATYDPLIMAGALGRAQILELRAAYERFQEEREETFSLREFHDRILQLALPLPLATEALMPAPVQRPTRRTRS